MHQRSHPTLLRFALAWSLTASFVLAFAAGIADASSDRAWSEFRTAVGNACTRQAVGVLAKPAVAVDPYGTEAAGIAIVSRGSRAAVCIYDKRSKRALLSGVLTLPAGPRTAHPQRLIDCSGKPVAEPKEIVLACADANLTAQRLSWAGWSEPLAVAVGNVSVNSCTPSCVAGTFSTYKVALIASGAKRCRNVLAYDTITYAYIGKTPPAQSGETIPYGCR